MMEHLKKHVAVLSIILAIIGPQEASPQTLRQRCEDALSVGVGFIFTSIDYAGRIRQKIGERLSARTPEAGSQIDLTKEFKFLAVPMVMDNIEWTHGQYLNPPNMARSYTTVDFGAYGRFKNGFENVTLFVFKRKWTGVRREIKVRIQFPGNQLRTNELERRSLENIRPLFDYLESAYPGSKRFEKGVSFLPATNIELPNGIEISFGVSGVKSEITNGVVAPPPPYTYMDLRMEAITGTDQDLAIVLSRVIENFLTARP